MSKTFEWEGDVYPLSQIGEVAIRAGVSAHQMRYYIDIGKTSLDDVNDYGADPKPFEFDGVQYPSTNEAARRLGKTKGVIRRWRREGIHTTEDAKRFKLHQGQPCRLYGNTYLSYRAAADGEGVSYYIARQDAVRLDDSELE